MNLQSKKKLEVILKKIQRRYSWIFWTKLVLFNQEIQSEDRRIRHYDIESEAVINIVDILQTKIKKIHYNFLFLLTNTTQNNNSQFSPQPHPKKYHNKSPQSKHSSQQSPNYMISSINYTSNPLNHSKRYSQIKSIASRKQRMISQLSELDCSMYALVSKIKQLSNKFNKKNKQMHMDAVSQSNHSHKIEKQKLIISRLNKLENDLQVFFDQDTPNKKMETTSNISYRRNQVPNLLSNSTPNTNKTERNRTFTTSFTQDNNHRRKKW